MRVSISLTKLKWIANIFFFIRLHTAYLKKSDSFPRRHFSWKCISHYGNMGFQVSKRGIQNQIDFLAKCRHTPRKSFYFVNRYIAELPETANINSIFYPSLWNLITDIKGGFQLLDLIIPELKSHVIPYKFKCSHWWKIHL